MANDSQEALYLFCFAHSGKLPALTEMGVDGQTPLEAWRFREVAAVVSNVSREEFCGPQAESRLRDLAWIAPRAYRHEVVIEHVLRSSPVLPARFATLFSSAESLLNLLQRNYDQVSRFLTRMVDHEEWGVKVLLDREKATAPLMRLDELADLSPGKRYFQEKRLRSEVERELKSWRQKVCRGIVDDLSQLSEEIRERQVLSDEKEAVLKLAMLVPRSAVAALRERLAQANAAHDPHGLRFELSGPWPPYSFSQLDWMGEVG